MIPPSSLVLSSGWGLIDLPLRAAFSPAHPLADTFHPPYPPIASQSIPWDVPLARRGPSNPLYLSLREWPRLPFTARIGRAQFHRARSASKKDTWPLPPHPSEAARCASPEDHQAPSPPLFREHRTNVGVLPILFIVRVLRARRMVWWLPIPSTWLPSPVEGRLTKLLYRRSIIA
jgi:hypothetical protein